MRNIEKRFVYGILNGCIRLHVLNGEKNEEITSLSIHLLRGHGTLIVGQGTLTLSESKIREYIQ